MRLAFNQTKDRVLFLYDNAKEYKWMHAFPAFIKDGPNFSIHAKVQVLHNVVQRLKKAKVTLRADQDVADLLSSPFNLRKIPSTFKYFTEPMDYQDIALRYLYTVGSGGLLLDPGMGKSKVVLDYIHLMSFKKVIIVCPLALLFVWEDEIPKHRPELNSYTVKTTDWDSEKEGICNSQVTLINYTKAVGFKQQLKTVGFDFIHLDEFLIKDVKTERTKSLTDLSYRIPYKCGGSGTLINNTIMDVFCPVRYLEPALTGVNYKNFFDRHCVSVVVNKGTASQRNQVVGFKGAEEARSILESCCIVMTKEKWLKLPKKNFHDIYVPMGAQQQEAYYSLMRNYVADINGKVIEVDNPLVMMSKLYQISNGFVYYTPPEEIEEECRDLIAEDPKKSRKKSKRETIFLGECAKVDALKTLLTGKLSDKRAIIWFNMSAEYQLISQMLEVEGQTFMTIKGGEKATGDKVRKFNNDPSIQWLVCQAKSVNYGITVLGTTHEKLEEENIEVLPDMSPEIHTQVFFSMNFSLEVYLQQQDRIHRLGQKHECDYYRLFSISPVEKRIREAIEGKMELRWEMLVDVAEKLMYESK